MAFYDSPQGKAGLAIVAAALVGYIAYSGEVIRDLGVPGLGERAARVEQARDTLTFLRGQTESARRELARGSIEDVKRRVDEHRGTLRVLRSFVPDGSEVPNLLDDISTRAKIRGVNLSQVRPQPIEPGPSPFDTYSYEMAVIGRYDQVARFLTDIASLRRIIVPRNLTLGPAQSNAARALGDSTAAMLEARFHVRTYVKASSPDDGGPSGS